MSDEPTLGELSRRIDGLTGMLAQLVSRAEYAAEQRLVEQRIQTISNDVAELRRAMLTEVTGVRTALEAAVTRLEAADEKREEQRGSNTRQLVYAALVPAVLVMLSTVVQIWLAMRGP